MLGDPVDEAEVDVRGELSELVSRQMGKALKPEDPDAVVLVGGSDSTATATQPYIFGDQKITPTDRRQRSVVSTLVSLRNTVP